MTRYVIIFVFLFSISSFAQNNIIGFGAGVNWSNVNTKDFLDDKNKDSRLGFSGDLIYEYFFNEHLFLKTGVTYSQRGFSLDSHIYDDVGNVLNSITTTFNYDYLAIPLTIGYRTKGDIYFFGNIGFLPAMLVSAKTKTPIVDHINGEIIKYETYDVKDRVTNIDYGGIVKLGIGYELDKSYTIFSSFSYNYSFNTITNSEYFGGSNIYHWGLNLLLGLKYKINI